MKAPWIGKTGLAKATAILATVLLVSLGLCGVNFLVVASSDSPRLGGLRDAISVVFIGTALAEWAAILLSVAGLVTVAVIAVWRALRRDRSNGESGTES